MEINAEKLFNLLNEQTPFDHIRHLLDRLPPEILVSAKNDDLDVLQAAIIGNQIETIQYLTNRRIFTEYTHQPICNSYLHLAVKLGLVSVVQILLECRPLDFRAFSTVCYPEKCTCSKNDLSELEDGEVTAADTELTPLEVSVKFLQLKCLKLLLQSKLLESKLELDLERACELNYPEALELLLAEAQNPLVIRRAFEQSVRRKLARCIACLAPRLTTSKGDDCGEVFGGLNPYHVMYQYSSGFTLRPDDCVTKQFVATGLGESTRVLIKNKFSVHAFKPANTYPLLTLLHSIFSEFCQYPSDDQFACIELLLKAGADPNFNEFVCSKVAQPVHSSNAFGRGSYASALHAVSFDPFYPGQTWELSRKVVSLLLRHGADPYKVCTDCKLIPLALFLTRLSDVDMDEYIMVMEDTPLEMVGMADAVADVIQVYYLGMTTDKFNATINPLIKKLSASIEYLGDQIIERIEQIRRNPKSLIQLSQLASWEGVGRCEERLEKLDVSRAFKQLILKMFY